METNNPNHFWFSEQIKNFKYAVLITLWMTPTLVSGQNTIPTDKAKIEVVQQSEDPVKDLMKKYHVDTLIDVEMLDLKDMIAMLKEVYYITNTDKKLELSFIELTKKLEGCIDGETRGFDFASLKPKISDEEKKLDQQLAQKTAQIENLNQSIKSTKADIDRTKQVISMLEWSKK